MHTQVPTERSVPVGVRVCVHVFMCVYPCVCGGRVCLRARVCGGGGLCARGGRAPPREWQLDLRCCEGQGAEPQCRSGQQRQSALLAVEPLTEAKDPRATNPGSRLMSPPQRGLHWEDARAHASVPLCLSVPLSSQVRE